MTLFLYPDKKPVSEDFSVVSAALVCYQLFCQQKPAAQTGKTVAKGDP